MYKFGSCVFLVYVLILFSDIEEVVNCFQLIESIMQP